MFKPFVLAAAAAGLVAGSLATGIAPASADQHMKRKSTGTKVTVTQRSYLDPGVVLQPETRGYLNYVRNFHGRPDLAFDPAGSTRGPLPGRFDLPGF
jgi:hypothetical protein